MNYDQKLTVGKALRSLMVSKGRSRVFQNIYETGTRSVKCYRPNAEAEFDLRMSVAKLMGAFGVKEYQVVFTKGTRWGAPGFIVKF